jgi:hypothetical protein
MYKVKVFYMNEKLKTSTINCNLTLKEAQDICADPESFWNTCTKSYLKRRTRERGAWFLGYTEE